MPTRLPKRNDPCGRPRFKPSSNGGFKCRCRMTRPRVPAMDTPANTKCIVPPAATWMSCTCLRPCGLPRAIAGHWSSSNVRHRIHLLLSFNNDDRHLHNTTISQTQSPDNTTSSSKGSKNYVQIQKVLRNENNPWHSQYIHTFSRSMQMPTCTKTSISRNLFPLPQNATQAQQFCVQNQIQ